MPWIKGLLLELILALGITACSPGTDQKAKPSQNAPQEPTEQELVPWNRSIWLR